MPCYEYKALDADGRSVAGQIDAPGRSEAIALLAGQQAYVTDIAEQGPPAANEPARALRLSFRRRVPPRARAAMLAQLATALQAGLPLASALGVVRQQAESAPLRELAGDLVERVQTGESLSDAMAAHPREFSRLETSMVRVGETAGVLDDVMVSLAEFAEKDVDIREKVRSAATYPIFVLCLAVVSVVVIVTVVLPRVIGTVTEATSAAALPLPTRILLGLSSLLTGYGWLLALAALAAGTGFARWVRQPAGRLAFDRFKLRLPVVGQAVRRVAVARFARTLGTLSRSGIQILEALRVMRDTLGNEALARQVDRVAAEITQGQSIAEPLRQTGQFPPLLIQVIALGEKTGRLDELLLKTADAYEKETAAAIGRMMSILPAVFIVLMALVVGFILAAVLLPIIGMETALPHM